MKKSPTPNRNADWLPSSNMAHGGGGGGGLVNHMTSGQQWLDVAESDVSSLPDASCDLVHLAQLSHAARMNPNLSDLARQQVPLN